MNKSNNLALKVLLISLAHFWFSYQHREIIFIFIGVFLIFALPKISGYIDSSIEEVVKKIGFLLLQIILFIIYFIVIIPTKLFHRNKSYTASSYISVKSKKIDFGKLW